MSSGNELTELYDSLAVLYRSLPPDTDLEWREALKSVLYGGELLATGASCYGAQQKTRNVGTRKEYAEQHGDGSRVTAFSAITTAKPRESDRQYVSTGARLPIAPESGQVLPVNVSSEEVDWAISLLAEFPAEPAADQPGNGGDVLIDPIRVRQARKSTSCGATAEETRILFVSDTHLGYENRAVTGSGKVVPWIQEVSSVGTFQQVCEIAIEQAVDAVIHTGDILDHEVDAATLDAAASSLEMLSLQNIPVYCILGTHDHGSGNPQHRDSVDGIAWLKRQVREGRLIELSLSPTPVGDGSVDAYGISAEKIGLVDVRRYDSLGWNPSKIAFGASRPGPNVLCLHEGATPYREQDSGALDLDALLAQSRVSFDCVLVGDEHRPKNGDFEFGYTFETHDGTLVLYTGPAARIGPAYHDHDAFVTEITISANAISYTRHLL